MMAPSPLRSFSAAIIIGAIGLMACLAAEPAKPAAEKPPPRVAAIVTTYYPVTHADLIVGRLLKGYTLDGRGESPRMRLASLYTDQVPGNDISRKLAKDYGFPI